MNYLARTGKALPRDITAKDVAQNIERFCDDTVEGNAMAGKMQVIVDPEASKMRSGTIEIIDDHTLTLSLPQPDISLISGFTDYPAAIVHSSFNEATMLENAIGTGPYLSVSYDAGSKAVLVRNPDHQWWNVGNGAYMDRIEFIDYGAEPGAHFSGAEADEVDVTYDT